MFKESYTYGQSLYVDIKGILDGYAVSASEQRCSTATTRCHIFALNCHSLIPQHTMPLFSIQSILSSLSLSSTQHDELEDHIKSLPSEVRHRIFTNFVKTCPLSTLLSLMRSSQSLHNLVGPQIYETLCITHLNANSIFYGLEYEQSRLKGWLTQYEGYPREHSYLYEDKPTIWDKLRKPIKRVPVRTYSDTNSIRRKLFLLDSVKHLTISDGPSLTYIYEAWNNLYKANNNQNPNLFQNLESISIRRQCFMDLRVNATTDGPGKVLNSFPLFLQSLTRMEKICIDLPTPLREGDKEYTLGTMFFESFVASNMSQDVKVDGLEVVVHNPGKRVGVGKGNVLKVYLSTDMKANRKFVDKWLLEEVGCQEIVIYGLKISEEEKLEMMARAAMRGLSRFEIYGPGEGEVCGCCGKQ